MSIDIDLLSTKRPRKPEKPKEPKIVMLRGLDRNYRVIEIDLNTTFTDYAVFTTHGMSGTIAKKLDIIKCDGTQVYIKFNDRNIDGILIGPGDYFHDFEIHEIYVTNNQSVSNGKLILLLRW